MTPDAVVAHEAHSSTSRLGATGRRQYFGSQIRMLEDTEPPLKVHLFKLVIWLQNLALLALRSAWRAQQDARCDELSRATRVRFRRGRRREPGAEDCLQHRRPARWSGHRARDRSAYAAAHGDVPGRRDVRAAVDRPLADGLVAIIADLGVTTTLARELAKSPADADRLGGDLLRFRLFSSLGSVLLLLVAIPFLPYTTETKVALLISLPAMVFTVLGGFPGAFFQTHLRQELNAAVNVLTRSLGLIAILVVRLFDLGLYGLVGLLVAVNGIGCLVAFAVLTKLLANQCELQLEPREAPHSRRHPHRPRERDRPASPPR